jgi:glycosyltransferase involved in cell wall biosynthesis
MGHLRPQHPGILRFIRSAKSPCAEKYHTRGSARLHLPQQHVLQKLHHCPPPAFGARTNQSLPSSWLPEACLKKVRSSSKKTRKRCSCSFGKAWASIKGSISMPLQRRKQQKFVPLLESRCPFLSSIICRRQWKIFHRKSTIEEVPKFVFVGRIHPIKGLDLLLETLKKIKLPCK